MEVIKNLDEIKEKVGLTIGNFDGVHFGHRSFLDSIREDAYELGLKFALITFVPHPLQILKPKDQFLINSYEERRELLEELGVDYLCEIDFTRDFSTLSPQQFLDNYVFTNSLIGKFYLGYDFAFGANKSGDHDFVKTYCQKKDIPCVTQDEFKIEDTNISSSSIRKKIEEGKVDEAAPMLSRSFFMNGNIIKGKGRGKEIGFPTANLKYAKDRLIPERGVYATRTVYKSQTYTSITNIGFNPTFEDGSKLHIETHILNFDKDIYGEELKVIFLKKIRDEKKFDGVNELVTQIKEDIIAVKEVVEK